MQDGTLRSQIRDDERHDQQHAHDAAQEDERPALGHGRFDAALRPGHHHRLGLGNRSRDDGLVIVILLVVHDADREFPIDRPGLRVVRHLDARAARRRREAALERLEGRCFRRHQRVRVVFGFGQLGEFRVGEPDVLHEGPEAHPRPVRPRLGAVPDGQHVPVRALVGAVAGDHVGSCQPGELVRTVSQLTGEVDRRARHLFCAHDGSLVLQDQQDQSEQREVEDRNGGRESEELATDGRIWQETHRRTPGRDRCEKREATALPAPFSRRV